MPAAKGIRGLTPPSLKEDSAQRQSIRLRASMISPANTPFSTPSEMDRNGGEDGESDTSLNVVLLTRLSSLLIPLKFLKLQRSAV